MAAVSVMRNIKKVEWGRAEDNRRKTKSKIRKKISNAATLKSRRTEFWIIAVKNRLEVD